MQQQLLVACSGSASEHTASSAATDDVYQTLSLADTASPQQVFMSLFLLKVNSLKASIALHVNLSQSYMWAYLPLGSCEYAIPP